LRWPIERGQLPLLGCSSPQAAANSSVQANLHSLKNILSGKNRCKETDIA
jgi:hypothetical protein